MLYSIVIFKVLHLTGSRPDMSSDAVKKMYSSSEKLNGMVAFTMQDAANTLKLMYELNVMPLALQITSIAGKHHLICYDCKTNPLFNYFLYIIR